jgi:NodT family efflux transporter outer membrane factor (OMF) lipoprotein
MNIPKSKLICYKGFVLFAFLTTGFFWVSCTYVVDEDIAPLVEAGPSFSLPTEAEKSKRRQPWWEVLNDPFLNSLITKALADNFTLKQVHARIEQAQAVEKQTGSLLYPAVSGELSGTSKWNADGKHDDNLVMEMGLSWEVDLWNQLSSAAKAAVYESQATRDELADMALLLSTQVADTYFQLIEQRLQLALLSRQIEASRTFLELIKLRFAYGSASVVDVYQQRQQLAAIRTQLPVVRSRLSTLDNRFHVLLGMVPAEEEMQFISDLPVLPPLPKLGIPADLLLNRPDLRRLHRRLVAADYRVATAVAERLPKIRLGGKAGFQGSELSSDGLFVSLFGEAIAPLVDWGRRKAEVDKRKAMVKEEIAGYSQAYLVAIEEVENALWQGKEQAELVKALDEQLRMSKATLSESRNRYMQGLSDYLPVLTALQALQRLERDILMQQRQLISIRILLYRALGGSDLPESSPGSIKIKEDS